MYPKNIKAEKANTESPEEDLAVPSLKTIESLNEMATSKLTEIVRKSVAGEKGWTGFDEAEVIASRELLDRDVQKVSR